MSSEHENLTTDALPEVHDLEPSDFERRVRSFEHWFEAVEGYIGGLHNGHLDLPCEAIGAEERERLIAVLCSYCIGEDAALQGAAGLVRLAPNTDFEIFLATQVADEARHLEVMRARLADLGLDVTDEEIERRAAPSILAFRERLLHLVDEREWACALFAQNVMLESMEYVTFAAHAKTCDPLTRDMLERVLRDERRHLGFGENEIARYLRSQPNARPWLREVKQELDGLVRETFEHAGREIGIAKSDAPSLGQAYVRAVGRLGLD